MRLTVHVTGAKKHKVEKKDSKGNVTTYWKCPSTLAYYDVEEEDVSFILTQIEKDKLGKPFKHYLSNEKIPGRSRGKKATS